MNKKTYTLGEVMQAYEDGYKGSFQKGNGVILSYGDTIKCIFNEGKEEWTKCGTQVDFTTAIEEFHNNKNAVIYCITDDGHKTVYKREGRFALYDNGGIALGSKEILYGKWFIADEEMGKK